MTKYTEAQKRAILKYQAEHAVIKITIEKEQKEKFVKLAKLKDVSLTKLIIDLLEIESYKYKL